MTDSEILTAARTLLADPARWWRGPNTGDAGRGCHCPLTAMTHTAIKLRRIEEVCRLFALAGGLKDSGEIAAWHDRPCANSRRGPRRLRPRYRRG